MLWEMKWAARLVHWMGKQMVDLTGEQLEKMMGLTRVE